MVLVEMRRRGTNRASSSVAIPSVIGKEVWQATLLDNCERVGIHRALKPSESELRISQITLNLSFDARHFAFKLRI